MIRNKYTASKIIKDKNDPHLKLLTHRVTLNILRRRTQRKTEMPRGDMMASSTKMVSTIPPQTTKQSKRLKSDTK